MKVNESYVESLFGKKVKVVTDENVWVGMMDYFSGSNDEESGEYCFGLNLEDRKNGVEFYAHEIKSICEV